MGDSDAPKWTTKLADELLGRAQSILERFGEVERLSLADQIAYAQSLATVGAGYAALALATQREQPAD